MWNSKLNPTCTFTEEYWVISVLNVGSKMGGHSMIVVEGARNVKGQVELFIGQYDIRAMTNDQEQGSSSTATGSDGSQSCSSSARKASCSTTSTSCSIWNTTDSTSGSASAKSPGNIRGHITEVRCFESNKYDRDYSSFTSRSFPYVAKKDALKMIESIKADASQTERANHGMDEHLSYQLFASDTFFGDKNGGVNCAQWVKQKLEVARIEHGDSKSKPEKVAGGSVCALM